MKIREHLRSKQNAVDLIHLHVEVIFVGWGTWLVDLLRHGEYEANIIEDGYH